MTDFSCPADDDLQARYDLLCELEHVIADIELDDLTREDLIELIAVFDRIGPAPDTHERPNVVAFAPRRSTPYTSWSLFKDKIRRERHRIGQLIGAEVTRPLPPEITAIDDPHRPISG